MPAGETGAVASGLPANMEGSPVNSNAASDYSKTGDRGRQFAGALPVDAPAELATGRYGPLASLIVVSLLSLGIWAAIWALLGSLLWG
jgi:hypothetical protein